METIIQPKDKFKFHFAELWTYRELCYAFARRDIAVRYKQTVLGILWVIIQPFLLMVVFTIFFGNILNVANEGVPYPLFVFTGLLFWTFFANALTNAANSMIMNQAIIQKIYFPRIIIPLSSTLVFFLDFIVSAGIFCALLIYYQVTPSLLGVALLVPALVFTILTFLGLGFFFAAINVTYRDVRYVLPFFVQLLLFVTPVIYAPSVLGAYQWLWYLNPMSGVIDTMRATLLHTGTVDWTLFLSSGVTSLFIFIVGFMYFRRTEATFADTV